MDNEVGLSVEVFIRFKFPTTINQVEYELIIARLTLVVVTGAEKHEVKDKLPARGIRD